MLSYFRSAIYNWFFHWQYVPKKKSPIEGFTLHYKEYSAQTNFTALQLLEPNIRSYMIQDLKPAAEYTIKLQSFNTAGYSDLSNEVVMRTKGGKSKKSLRERERESQT